MVKFPANVAQAIEVDKSMQILLPEGQQVQIDDKIDPIHVIYRFPADSHIRYEPVNRWSLAARQ